MADLEFASQSLAEAIVDHARQGCRLRFETPAGAFRAPVECVGPEIVRLVPDDDVCLDLVLDHVVSVDLGDRTGPTPVPFGQPRSVVARVRELANEALVVELGLRTGSVMTGVVAGVAATHLELVDGTRRRLIGIAEVVWVRAPRPSVDVDRLQLF